MRFQFSGSTVVFHTIVKNSPALRLVAAAIAILCCLWAPPAAAQTGGAGAEAGAASPTAEALERARRDGATIVVVPQDGAWDYNELGGAGGTPLDVYEQLAEGYVADASMLDRTESGVATFRSMLQTKLTAASNVVHEVDRALAEASPTGAARHFLEVIAVVAFGLALGFAIELFIYGYRIVGPWFIAQQTEDPQGYLEKLPILSLRVVLAIGGALVSATTAAVFWGAFFYIDHQQTVKTVILLLVAYILMRMVVAIWRMILSPYLSRYRIPSMSDADARRLFRWLSFVATFGIGVEALCYWLLALGVSVDVHAVVAASLTLFIVLMNIAMIRTNHRAISQAIMGGPSNDDASVVTRFAAKIWAPLAGLYFAVAWAEMTYRLILDLPLGVSLIGGAYTVLLVVLVVYAVISYAIEWSFNRRRLYQRAALAAAAARAEEAERFDGASPMRLDGDLPDGDDDEGGVAAGRIAQDPPPLSAPGVRMRTMEDLARRVASIFAVIAGGWALLRVWGADQPMEGSVAASWLVDVAWVVFFGYVAFHAVRIAIDQKIEEEGGFDVAVEPGDEGGGAAAASRLATLLPLFRNFLLVTIGIVTVLMALLELGVNVTPIFAGAGVLGLAIGFGAQTLVRDIFSGIFFLVDDAFRKGEYIDIGAVKGTVEKISIRSFQLRHHLGYLHTIPFGEIQYLTNYSRDWVMMKLPLRLTYDTDVEKVRKLIKTLGKELQQDPDIGPKFLQPLKSQGVYQMEESAMILRVKFMTRPGEQWVIRKRVYAEIRELFEREGVKFAHREVTVHVAETASNPLTEEQKSAVAGAVRPILDPPVERALALQDDR